MREHNSETEVIGQALIEGEQGEPQPYDEQQS